MKTLSNVINAIILARAYMLSIVIRRGSVIRILCSIGCSSHNAHVFEPYKTQSKQRHTTERNFICLECSKAFKTMRCLSRHQKIHSGIRPYACEYCDKRFYKNDKLKVHLRIHTGERPYKCDQCDYAAVTRGNLRKHQNNKHKIHEVHDLTPFMPMESYQKANTSI